MNEFTLLIEEWEADIQRLNQHLASQASAPQARAERLRIQCDLHQARQAQLLLRDLSQVHNGTFSAAA